MNNKIYHQRILHLQILGAKFIIRYTNWLSLTKIYNRIEQINNLTITNDKIKLKKKNIYYW